MDKNNKSVFPILHKAGELVVSEGGITKREYFALQILLSKPNTNSAYMIDAINETDEFLKMLN